MFQSIDNIICYVTDWESINLRQIYITSLHLHIQETPHVSLSTTSIIVNNDGDFFFLSFGYDC